MKNAQEGRADLISDLAQDIVNLILVLMPIRDAVRTSVLSKNWIHKWVSIPDLVFDDQGCSKRAHVVDQVLSHHVGLISKFSCMIYDNKSSSHIDRWIISLSRKSIKKFILTMKEKGYLDVPSRIFSCQELCHLELFKCRLEVPPTFKGFHKLLVLNLAVKISEVDIAYLISRCPLLERLILRVFAFYDCLHIHAPNLRYLELSGEFLDLSLENSPLLTNLSMHSCIPPDCWGVPGKESPRSLIHLISRLDGIERLKLKGCFLQYLSIGDVPKKLSTTSDHLTYLEIDIELNSKEILATLCILRSMPNLKELKIRYGLDEEQKRYGLSGEEDVQSQHQAEFCGSNAQFDCLLSHLRVVEIIGLFMLLDLELIRCILANAPMLKTMKIYTNKYATAEEVSSIFKELNQFQRASTIAEIINLGHYQESY